MSDELKLCPFDGAHPGGPVPLAGAKWAVLCTVCGVRVNGYSDAQAVERWNRRVPTPAASHALTRLAEYARDQARVYDIAFETGKAEGYHDMAERIEALAATPAAPPKKLVELHCSKCHRGFPLAIALRDHVCPAEQPGEVEATRL